MGVIIVIGNYISTYTEPDLYSYGNIYRIYTQSSKFYT